ncbi:shikimate dehydrogenase [Glaciecola sp. 1036]|uniref:shikimate dehydrogenase n=1 Tax=Alteromonadaceae TaxID=72275 RepID=UPI003CFC5054
MTFAACVFGNPIKQSKSPLIHQAFAKQFDFAFDYTKSCPEVADFEQQVKGFFSNPNSVGANVTLPFKERAFPMADKLNSQAQRAGAVNTLIAKDGTLIGDNTDGKGLVDDLIRHDVQLQGSRVLVIGAGGASKGALPALVDSGVASIEIYNRTQERAQELVNLVQQYAVQPIRLFEQASGYDLIINATSLSLTEQVPEISSDIFTQCSTCYDMVYLNEPTAFMTLAGSNQVEKCIDGLGMLVGQAAESFYLWFGKRPDVNPVLAQLRSDL